MILLLTELFQLGKSVFLLQQKGCVSSLCPTCQSLWGWQGRAGDIICIILLTFTVTTKDGHFLDFGVGNKQITRAAPRNRKAQLWNQIWLVSRLAHRSVQHWPVWAVNVSLVFLCALAFNTGLSTTTAPPQWSCITIQSWAQPPWPLPYHDRLSSYPVVQVLSSWHSQLTCGWEATGP